MSGKLRRPKSPAWLRRRPGATCRSTCGTGRCRHLARPGGAVGEGRGWSPGWSRRWHFRRLTAGNTLFDEGFATAHTRLFAVAAIDAFGEAILTVRVAALRTELRTRRDVVWQPRTSRHQRCKPSRSRHTTLYGQKCRTISTTSAVVRYVVGEVLQFWLGPAAGGATRLPPTSSARGTPGGVECTRSLRRSTRQSKAAHTP